MIDRLNLRPWSFEVSGGFTARGLHSEPSGRPVIHFVHGNSFCGLVYQAMLEPLAEHFDIFLSDVQGHGDSDHGGPFHGWNMSAEYCVEAWEHHAGLWPSSPVFSMGHSFGGAVSCLMMARYPRLFARSVLLDPVLFPPAMMAFIAMALASGLSKFNGRARRARRRLDRWPDAEAAFEYLSGRGIFEGWEDRCLSDYIRFGLREGEGELELKCRPSREAEVFNSYPRRLWRSLASIRTPTLLLHGEGTYPFVKRSAARLRKTNPFFRVEAMAGGHCFMQEMPAAAAARVLKELCLDDGERVIPLADPS